MRSALSALFVTFAATLLLLANGTPASAHGVVGKRFFPSTLAIEDPFVADELSLPTVRHVKTPGELETEISGELGKRLSPNLAVSFEGEWVDLDPNDGDPHQSGFENLEVGLKYTLLKNAPHEALFSLGFAWEVGGTGDREVEAESFSTFTPAFFFGKGFGDLPDSVELLKPLALTGSFGVAVPTRNATVTSEIDEFGDVETEREVNPEVAEWGFAVMYNLQYLQSFVKDVGLPRPFNRLIPLVELAFETPLNGPEANKTTGTVNPGVIWFGRFFQIGVEAVIPINDRTGKNVGVVGLIHFFLDDIAPDVFSWTPFHGKLGPTVTR